jgi:hypothetical protein
MLSYRPSRRRESGGDLKHPVVLQPITLEPPLLVVDVLPPAGVVDADRLEVPIGYRADPHLLPRRRNNQELATPTLFRGEAVPGLVQVDEPLPGAPPGPSGISW